MTKQAGVRTTFLTLTLLVSPASSQTRFVSTLDASQVVNNPSDSTATGVAELTLNADRTELAYEVRLFGLDLQARPEDRVDDNDVVGIHIHLNVANAIGPHVLNIFGNPSRDDADLVVDYENESFSGVFDASDASRDPNTGDVLPQAFPLTSKLFPTPFRLDELLNEEWYFAVHTVGNATTPPGVTIRGAINVVPEASTHLLTLLGLTLSGMRGGPVRAARRLRIPAV